MGEALNLANKLNEATEDSNTHDERAVINELKKQMRAAKWKVRVSKDKKYVMATAADDDYCVVTPMSKIMAALKGIKSLEDVEFYDILTDEAEEEMYCHHSYEVQDYRENKRRAVQKYFA